MVLHAVVHRLHRLVLHLFTRFERLNALILLKKPDVSLTFSGANYVVSSFYLELSNFLLVRLGLALELLDLIDEDGLVDPAGALGSHVLSETLAPEDDLN